MTSPGSCTIPDGKISLRYVGSLLYFYAEDSNFLQKQKLNCGVLSHTLPACCPPAVIESLKQHVLHIFKCLPEFQQLPLMGRQHQVPQYFWLIGTEKCLILKLMQFHLFLSPRVYFPPVIPLWRACRKPSWHF